jgi:outer membrane protein TolC
MRPFVLACAALLALLPPASAQDAGTTLTLADAIQLALQHNRALKVVSYGRGISRANLLVARGQFDPYIGFNRSSALDYEPLTLVPPLQIGSYRYDTYGVAFGGLTPVGTSYTFSENATNERYNYTGFANNFLAFGGVQVTQHLLKGFGLDANLAQVRIQKANRDISDLQFRDSAINTVTSVVLDYSSLQLAHDSLGTARRALSLAQALVTDNEKQYKVGRLAQSDLITARAQAAALEENVIVSERSVHDAENALRELVGEDVFFEDKPLFTLVPIDPPEVTVNLKADLQRALSMRPDYQEQRLYIVQSRAAEAAAANGLLPQVDFVGGYGYNGYASTLTASRQMVDQRMNASYSAGLQVTIPLTDAVGRGALRAAKLSRQQSEEQLRKLEADIAYAVTYWAGQIETTRKRVAANRTAYDLQKQALEAEEKKMLAGSSSTLVVAQQQQYLTSVENSLAGALANERQAVAYYDQALGTSLERYHVTLSVD